MLKTTRGLILSALLCAPAAAVAQSPLEEYAALVRSTMGLESNNALLERQIADQEQQILQLETSIELVPDFELQVPGLLEAMVARLEDFVAEDVPFLTEERDERVTELLLLLDDRDVDDAEKFRRVFEAWEIEAEYGRLVAAYTGQQDVDGVVRDVQFLRLGRLGLFYQTPDLEVAAAWHPRNREWIRLDSSHRNNLRQALRMASNQVAPDIALLPIMPPE